MISVFVIGLLPDFFAIAITSKKPKKIVCGSSPPRTGARHRCRRRGRLETLGMKMQPKNIVSGPENWGFAGVCAEKWPSERRFVPSRTLLQPNS
jgi:hypothetical protein